MAQKKYSIEVIRHSLAHILALSLQRIYGKVLFGVGPVIENGFYYDVQVKNGSITESDLPRIEQEMKKIIRQKLPFSRKRISLTEAKKLFKKLGQKYKLELLRDLEKYGTTVESQKIKIKSKRLKARKIKTVTIYQVGDFIDLCRGPHVKNTKDLPLSFQLRRVSGAYWRGNEKNPMLTRIEGVAFASASELSDYLKKIEEAEKRDHRILGEKLDLFHIDKEIGPGLILWHPKGALIKKIIEDYVLSQYLQNGYLLVNTPHIAQFKLWEISGHAGFYRENMFPPMHLREINPEEKIDYQLKPMNCPFHILIYKRKIRSYRDLPLRYTELGTVYRYERSGTLQGLVRVRGFTQDDAHIWCTGEQLEKEIKDAFFLALKILKHFGFRNFEIYLSTRPKKYIGKLKNWQKSTKALKDALELSGYSYQIDRGGGAFYGPKIDIKIKDALDRAWQCTTIQVDFNLPERFDMVYFDNKGRPQRPIMIHRALLGSLERFMGVLIEHYAGAFPLWLAPIQMLVLPVKEKHLAYAKKVTKLLREHHLRVEISKPNETLSKRIREGELQKVPYIIVVGDKEKKNNTIAVRKRGKGDMGTFSVSQFLSKYINKELKDDI